MLNVTQRQPQALAKQVAFKNNEENGESQEAAAPGKIGYTAPMVTSAVLASPTLLLNPSGTAGQVVKAAEISRFSLGANTIGTKVLAAGNTVKEKIVTSNIAAMLTKSTKGQEGAADLAKQILSNPSDAESILTKAGIKKDLIPKFQENLKAVEDFLAKGTGEGAAAKLGSAIRNPKLLFTTGVAVVAAAVAALLVQSANKARENAEL